MADDYITEIQHCAADTDKLNTCTAIIVKLVKGTERSSVKTVMLYVTTGLYHLFIIYSTKKVTKGDKWTVYETNPIMDAKELLYYPKRIGRASLLIIILLRSTPIQFAATAGGGGALGVSSLVAGTVPQQGPSGMLIFLASPPKDLLEDISHYCRDFHYTTPYSGSKGIQGNEIAPSKT